MNNSINQVAGRITRQVKPKDALPRNRKLHILIKFDRTNGYDEVAPLLRALTKRRSSAAFVRKAIVDAVKNALK